MKCPKLSCFHKINTTFNLNFIPTMDIIMMPTFLHMMYIPHHLTVLFFVHASVFSLVPNSHVYAQSTDRRSEFFRCSIFWLS